MSYLAVLNKVQKYEFRWSRWRMLLQILGNCVLPLYQSLSNFGFKRLTCEWQTRIRSIYGVSVAFYVSTTANQSSYKQLWNKKSYWMHSSYWHHPLQTTATLRLHCKVWTWNGSPSCSTCYYSRTACWVLTGKDLEGVGRPRETWTRTVVNDLKPANIGLHIAWQRAQDRTD